MKKHMIMSLAVIAALVIVPTVASAYGNPLGAYATSTTVAGVECRGASLVVLRTVRGANGPYISKTRPVRAGQWLLGSYSFTKDTTSCKKVPPGKKFDDKESVPYPIYMIHKGFGLSR